MRISKQMMISMAFIIGAVALICFGGGTFERQISDIPKKKDISSIQMYYDYANDMSEYYVIEDDKTISDIYKILLSARKNKSIESVNDSPTDVNEKILKIVINDKEDNNIDLFVYKAYYGKYYIEQPYEGIYEISEDEYNSFENYME